jgi:hypothetical protein
VPPLWSRQAGFCRVALTLPVLVRCSIDKQIIMQLFPGVLLGMLVLTPHKFRQRVLLACHQIQLCQAGGVVAFRRCGAKLVPAQVRTGQR